MLTWVTTGEMENKGFDVLKPTDDGTDFVSTGGVDGHYTSGQQTTYRFTDPQPVATCYITAFARSARKFAYT